MLRHSYIVFICVCLEFLIVCVNLGPKAVISHGEQDHYGWWQHTLLTAQLIKLYGGLWRRLGALLAEALSAASEFVHESIMSADSKLNH